MQGRHPDARRAWTLREILILAVLGAVFAILYLGWVQLWLVAQAAFGPISMDVVMGFWFVVSPLAAAIIRKPGAAFAAEVMAAAVELLLGSPGGLILVLSGAVQGAGAETVFALTRWRRYSPSVLMLSGVGAALFSFAYTWIRFDYGALAPGLLLAMLLIRCLSGAILGGFLAHLIAEALYRTGVLQGLRIDHDKRTAASA